MIINETENCIREDTRNPRRSRRGRGQLIMLTWIYNFFIGNMCSHKWKIIEQAECHSWHHNGRDTYKSGTLFVQQCEKCGEIKKLR